MNKSIDVLIKKFVCARMSKRDFLKVVSPIILDIPRLMKNKDEDLKHDFYVSIVGELEKIIAKYVANEQRTFEAWFTVALKYKYMTFIRKILRNNNYYLCDENAEINNIVYNAPEQKEENNKSLLNLNSLSQREQYLIKAKFRFEETSPITDRMIKRLERKKMFEDKIALKYVKLLNVQRKLHNETDPETISLLHKKEQKIIRTKRDLERAYNVIRTCLNTKEIAEYLGVAERSVWVYSNSIKSKLTKLGVNSFERLNYELNL